MEHVLDEIKELKKKCDFLKSENNVLREEIEEKSASFAKIETLYIKLKYDYYKLNDQSETMNEEQVVLRNKIADLNLQKDLVEEKNRVEVLSLVEELEELRRCVAERDTQIHELEEQQEKLAVSSEIMKLEVQLKNKLIEDMKNEIEDFEKHQCNLDTDLKQYYNQEKINLWKNVVPNHNIRTSIEKEIEFCSSRKSLRDELLGAWNLINDTDDALEIE